MNLRRYARQGKMLAVMLFALWFLAPRAEWGHYAFQVALALFSATLYASWQPQCGNRSHAVYWTTTKIVATGVFEVICLWLLFRLSGGKLLWTETLALLYMATFVGPLTVLFHFLLARPKSRLF